MIALSRVAAALAATLFPATITAAALQRPVPSPDDDDDDDEEEERPIGDPGDDEDGADDDEDDEDDEEETWQVKGVTGPAGRRPGSSTR